MACCSWSAGTVSGVSPVEAGPKNDAPIPYSTAPTAISQTCARPVSSSTASTASTPPRSTSAAIITYCRRSRSAQTPPASGPALGGVLIAVFGTGWLFAFDAGTFAVSVVSLAMLRLPPRSVPAPGSFLADLAEGWHELAIRPWYWINLIAHACWNFAMPAFLVIGPVISARSLGGATAWGLISASFGVGAAAAGLFVLRVKPRRPLVVGNLLLTLGALPLLALAFSRSVPLICAANVLDGFGLVALNGLWTPTMQVLIPENVRSRVNSYDWLVSLVIMPVGYAVAGPLASAVGYTTTLVTAAIVLSVPCALVVLVPGVRGVHRTASGEIVGPASEAGAAPAPSGG